MLTSPNFSRSVRNTWRNRRDPTQWPAAAASGVNAAVAGAGARSAAATASVLPRATPAPSTTATAALSIPPVVVCAEVWGTRAAGCVGGAAGDASGDSMTTTSCAPPPLTSRAAETVLLSVAGAAGAAGSAVALRCGAEATFQLRFAFLRASSAKVSWRLLVNFATVAMVMFWLGAGGQRGPQALQTIIFQTRKFCKKAQICKVCKHLRAQVCKQSLLANTTGCKLIRAIQ